MLPRRRVFSFSHGDLQKNSKAQTWECDDFDTPGACAPVVAGPRHWSLDPRLILAKSSGGSRSANVLVGFSASSSHCSGVSMTAGGFGRLSTLVARPSPHLTESWMTKSLGEAEGVGWNSGGGGSLDRINRINRIGVAHCSGVSMTAGVLARPRHWSLDPRLILAKSWTAKSSGEDGGC